MRQPWINKVFFLLVTGNPKYSGLFVNSSAATW